MILHAWRIVKSKHAAGAFTGNGAKQSGGRWNSPGRAVVYTAGSASLAMLELLVHLQADELLKYYVLFPVAFDERWVMTLPLRSLPRLWRRSPPPRAVQALGDRWIAGARSAVLRVPSAIVAGECNYLLNPAHADMGRIRIGPKQPIRFDRRLIKD